MQTFIAELQEKIGAAMPSSAAEPEAAPSVAAAEEATSSTAAMTVDELHSHTLQAQCAGYKKGAFVCKKNEEKLSFWRTAPMHGCHALNHMT